MFRNQSQVRILALVKRLQGCRELPPITKLAREFGVTRRTIHRDLDALEYAYWPVPRRATEDRD